MSRHSLAAAVAVMSIGALTLTACSGGSAKTEGSSSSGGATTLTIAYQKTSSFPQLDNLLKMVKPEFEKAHPGVTVDLQTIEAQADEYFTKLALMNKSKSKAPDIIYEDTFQVMSDAAAGYLHPMDEYLTGWRDWSQFPEAAQKAGAGIDGKIYGVSMGTDTRGIYFNKKIFAQAGLPDNWQPKNWDDLLAAARTVKEKVPGVIPLNLYAGKAGGEQTSMQGFEMLLYGTESTLYNESTHKWVTGSKGFTDALNFYKTLYGEGLAPSLDVALDANVGSRMIREFMPEGKVAISIDGSWVPGLWITKDAKWDEWQETMGFAKMPTQKGGSFISMSGGWLLSVGSQAKDPALAAEFIKMALNQKNSLFYDTTNSQIAVRQDVMKDPEYLNFNSSFEFFSSLIPYTKFRPATPDYSQISANIQMATEAVVTGEQSPEAAAKAYDEGLVKIVGADQTEAGH